MWHVKFKQLEIQTAGNLINTNPSNSHPTYQCPAQQPATPPENMPNSPAFQISADLFAGPARTLLAIIQRKEMEITDISISEIVDDFLAEMEKLPLDEISDFLTIAATLILLKSQSLLPDDPAEDLLEDLYPWEEKDVLLARLIECRTFRHASQHMWKRMESAALSAPRCSPLEERFWNLYPDPLLGVTAADLLVAYLRTSDKQPPPEVSIAHLSPVRFNVSDALEHIQEELPGLGQILFRDLPRRFPGRTGFVVYFLAILELWRQGDLQLHQVRTFGDITMKWSSP